MDSDDGSDGFGKILYDMHVASVKKHCPEFAENGNIKSWSQLREQAKEAWRETAVNYGEWTRS